MELRVARHTNDLEQIKKFYCDILDLEVLGSFKDHDGYDGIFIGIKNATWHLEFTADGSEPNHYPDEDDLLVFYFAEENEWAEIKNKLNAAGYEELIPRNPYWQKNGICFKDPDGFGIILTIK
jgi:catechol 2,3-dioxygenase-like lactoylglutathione lyase family enzyme